MDRPTAAATIGLYILICAPLEALSPGRCQLHRDCRWSLWFLSLYADQSGIRAEVWIETREALKLTGPGQLQDFTFGKVSLMPSKANDGSVQLSHKIFLPSGAARPSAQKECRAFSHVACQFPVVLDSSI
jgi:hypothetical protein